MEPARPTAGTPPGSRFQFSSVLSVQSVLLLELSLPEIQPEVSADAGRRALSGEDREVMSSRSSEERL